MCLILPHKRFHFTLSLAFDVTVRVWKIWFFFYSSFFRIFFIFYSSRKYFAEFRPVFSSHIPLALSNSNSLVVNNVYVCITFLFYILTRCSTFELFAIIEFLIGRRRKRKRKIDRRLFLVSEIFFISTQKGRCTFFSFFFFAFFFFFKLSIYVVYKFITWRFYENLVLTVSLSTTKIIIVKNWLFFFWDCKTGLISSFFWDCWLDSRI